MQKLTLDSPVLNVQGIGDKKAAAFSALGVSTVGDLLYRFPKAYQNRGDVVSLLQAASLDGECCSMILTVAGAPSTVTLKGRITITKFPVFDESGRCTAVFFNQPYIKNAVSLGATYRFWGKLVYKKGKWELVNPQFEAYSEKAALPDFVAVYHVGRSVSQKLMRSTVVSALSSLEPPPGVLPHAVEERRGLIPLCRALCEIHIPSDMQALTAAKRRLAFEELFIFAVAVKRNKEASKRSCSGTAISVDRSATERFISSLPFELTGAQDRVVCEILTDLEKNSAMHRIISGDVGSGKTVCAAAAVYAVVSDGRQAALMAPTEILARQHYEDLDRMFAPFGIKTALLSGSLSAKEKKEIREKLKNGAIDFVVGTHALISESTSFYNLALVITDEQHRFGVKQKSALESKGPSPHVLVMSATPIPRTLALVLYGDLDISVIDTMPPRRKKVSTFLVDESYRSRLDGFIAKCAGEGRQVYIVCPAIDDTSDDETEEEYQEKSPERGIDAGFGSGTSGSRVKRAVEYAPELAKKLPGISVGCLHGRMNPRDKEKVMEEFVCGRLSVLVSTTVIEVGVNVPNAVLMVVENAERFGLSQLHQLRGRVGRSEYKSWCILVSNTGNEESLARLDVLCRTYDGYKIAQADLEQRGPGDFIAPSVGAVRQHGSAGFHAASLCNDISMLNDAFSDAEELLKNDPELLKKENSAIAAATDALVQLS